MILRQTEYNNWRGAWDSGRDYIVYDIVEFDGSAYVCIKQHTNQTPPNLTYWNLFIGSQIGPQGPQGPQGLTGTQGNQGYQGDQGLTGNTGSQGEVGEQGPMGPQGFQGETGDIGPQGDRGYQGFQGDAGPTGPEFIPQVTNFLYVDNKRTDIYTPDGSIIRPFLTIQAAHDAITGNSSTNRFEIRIATGAYYSEVLTLSKDQIVLVGQGGLTGLTGAITITSLHLRFENLRINSNVTLSLPTGFLLECDGCQTTTGVWNITATAPVGNEFVQILRSRLWSSQINITGIKGIVGFSGGMLQGPTFNITNSELQIANVDADTLVLNLKTGTHAELGGSLVQRSTLDIDAASDAQVDATWLGTNTLVNAGTLILMTKGGDINNDSSVVGASVKDALETLKNSIISINPQVGTSYQLEITDAGKIVTLTNASPISVTIPTNLIVPFLIGTQIQLIQGGAGKVTFSGVGVTIKSKSSNKSIGAQNVAVALIQESIDTWYLIGDLIV